MSEIVAASWVLSWFKNRKEKKEKLKTSEQSKREFLKESNRTAKKLKGKVEKRKIYASQV